jgi:hypothetical protein
MLRQTILLTFLVITSQAFATDKTVSKKSRKPASEECSAKIEKGVRSIAILNNPSKIKTISPMPTLGGFSGNDDGPSTLKVEYSDRSYANYEVHIVDDSYSACTIFNIRKSF